MNPSDAVSFPAFAVLFVVEVGKPENAHLRQGQLLFNLLSQARKDLADGLLATPDDPFFLEFIPEQTWRLIESRWGSPAA